MRKNLYADLYQLEETHWWHKAKRELCSQFLRTVWKGKKLKILDIGCGTGGNMKAFEKFGEVHGVDISPDAIAFCKKRELKHVRIGSAYRTKYPSSSFDVVTMLDVLEHVDDKKALSEVKRILRPNGILILTVPAYKLLWSRWDEALHHKRRYSKDEIISLLQSKDFAVCKCSYLYSFLFLPVLLIRSLKSAIRMKEYSSDFRLNPGPTNWILLKLALLEHKIVQHLEIPFGTSVFCVAKIK